MSYTPTEWKAGDTVTSTKLNKIEQGIQSAASGGAYIIDTIFNDDDDSYTLTQTAAEIFAAAQTNYVITKEQSDDSLYLNTLITASINDDGNYVFLFGTGYTYSANSADEYPKTIDGK